MKVHKTSLTSWSLYPKSRASLLRPERLSEVFPKGKPCLARGSGTSLGDAALNKDGTVVLMERMNRFISFDEKTGVLCVEAGAKILEILHVIVPKGWGLPICPSVGDATIGGLVAMGALGSSIRELKVIVPGGIHKHCSPTQETELYRATMGGLGLTGIIIEVTIQLIPIESAYIKIRRARADNLEELLSLLKNTTDSFRKAELDLSSIGKGTVITAHFASVSEISHEIDNPLEIKIEKKRSELPILPIYSIHPWGVKAIHHIRSRWKKGVKKTEVLSLGQFYRTTRWNRLYGKRGFISFQCVIPEQGIQNLLSTISQSRFVPAKATLTYLDNEGESYLSYHGSGICLEAFFPNIGGEIFELIHRLNRIVFSLGGKVTPSTPVDPVLFRQMYPQFVKWCHVKQIIDPDWAFQSDLSRRLKMERGS